MICSKLVNVFKKHRKEKIILIAHSLGSIIAYDALTQIAAEGPIETLVTIGAPQGLPIMNGRIIAERRKDPAQKGVLKTPENIRSHWYNLADVRDKTAINCKLQDDFKKNARHFGPVDGSPRVNPWSHQNIRLRLRLRRDYPPYLWGDIAP